MDLYDLEVYLKKKCNSFEIISHQRNKFIVSIERKNENGDYIEEIWKILNKI
jgi:hypothetical protein